MVSTDATDDAAAGRTIGHVRLAGHGLVALMTVCIVNVLVLFAGFVLFEYPPEFVGGAYGPLAVGPVLVNSAVAAVGATVVYAIVARYSARPDGTFILAAATVFVLSFGMFLAPDLAGAPPSVYGTLAVMHVTTAAVVVGVLTRASEPRAAAPPREVAP